MTITSSQTMPQAVESAVRQAARDFATALAATPQFEAFEQASEALEHDAAAQEAMVAYQTKQNTLQMMIRLNAVSVEERAELARLEQTFLAQPTVAVYLQAQQELTDLCRLASETLSARIGLNFAAACRPTGCCS